MRKLPKRVSSMQFISYTGPVRYPVAPEHRRAAAGRQAGSASAATSHEGHPRTAALIIHDQAQALDGSCARKGDNTPPESRRATLNAVGLCTCRAVNRHGTPDSEGSRGLYVPRQGKFLCITLTCPAESFIQRLGCCGGQQAAHLHVEVQCRLWSCPANQRAAMEFAPSQSTGVQTKPNKPLACCLHAHAR